MDRGETIFDGNCKHQRGEYVKDISSVVKLIRIALRLRNKEMKCNALDLEIIGVFAFHQILRTGAR